MHSGASRSILSWRLSGLGVAFAPLPPVGLGGGISVRESTPSILVGDLGGGGTSVCSGMGVFRGRGRVRVDFAVV